MLLSIFPYFALILTSYGQVLDNRETCAHRVVNCDPNVDHFETKISMEHASSVTQLEYENTHLLLEQSWPTRGPWMKETAQKIVFVRCGCPIPSLSNEWSEANIIHVPVSSVMVQMSTTLSKLYLMGQRSKVAAIESNRYISDATPEVATDISDGIIRRLDLSPNGIPSTMITVSFTGGSFSDASSGFRLQLINNSNSSVLGQTECIFPASDGSMDPFDEILDRAFNSIPDWVDAGKVWVLKKGEASAEPSTSLSYTLYFDNQLSMGLSISGEASTCGSDIGFKVERDSAPSKHPIYYRLHDLPGGFPDVLITEPRSLGPLANDEKVSARRFIDSDPGEATPLGRAELMKLMALITGSVATANNLFDMIEVRYMDAKALATNALYRPTVMVGKPGTWNEAARNSWMVTVGSTYVGQFLRDANVEFRNSEDDVNKKICGSGCGVCPSGTSDTRCSVPIDDYLDLFRSADYWISAGIGANCWSASCNFEITSDALLDQNRDIFSQFLAMQCGSVIGLDKAHNGSGNSYWETGRLRPDLILMDLVSLMHPDLDIQAETTFFRMLPPASNLTGVASCPRTILPPKPDSGTVHVTARFTVSIFDAPTLEIIGAPYFAVIERFNAGSNKMLAEFLDVDDSDLEIVMANGMTDEANFGMAITIRVPDCPEHSCAVEVGRKLEASLVAIENAIDLDWVSVQHDSSHPIRVLDRQGDIIPLVDLVVPEISATAPSTGENDGGDGIGAGAIAGIAVGVLAAFLIGMFVAFRMGREKGAEMEIISYEKDMVVIGEEGPDLVCDEGGQHA